MAESGAEIVLPSNEDLRADRYYQNLLAKCLIIREEARTSNLLHMWRLGERIDTFCTRRSREETYGARVVATLAEDLAMDHTTIKRARQLYKTFTRQEFEEIIEARHEFLTWSKLRMLLPLADDERAAILERIKSGELRTDNDCHTAILLMQVGAPNRKDRILPHDLGVKGLDLDHINALYGRAEPAARAVICKSLIPHMRLEYADRSTQISGIREVKKALAEYERQVLGDTSDV